MGQEELEERAGVIRGVPERGGATKSREKKLGWMNAGEKGRELRRNKSDWWRGWGQKRLGG